MSDQSDVCYWSSTYDCASDCSDMNGIKELCGRENGVRTCGRKTLPIDLGSFRTGCGCAQGMVLLDGVCVEESECGCTTDDGGQLANGYSHEDCFETCTCSDGVYECVANAECKEGCDPADCPG